MLAIFASTVYPWFVAPRVKFSDQVRAAVEASGRSRYSICKEIELAQSNLSRFMSGEKGLSMDALDRLGILLGLELRRRKGAKRSKP
jgi:hypothetical protein